MGNLEIMAVNEHVSFISIDAVSDTFFQSVHRPRVYGKNLGYLSCPIKPNIIFRFICSSMTQSMVASKATSRRRMENFSSKANPFTSSTRRNLAPSNGARLVPITSLNRQESSQPKRSMFLCTEFSNAKLTRWAPEPTPIWRLVPRKSSFQHLRPMRQCMYAVLTSKNIIQVTELCVFLFWKTTIWQCCLFRSQMRPVRPTLLHLLLKFCMTIMVSWRAWWPLSILPLPARRPWTALRTKIGVEDVASITTSSLRRQAPPRLSPKSSLRWPANSR